jgi:hypothetical protein
MRRDFATRVNKLPKWARDYIHNVQTFVGAPEVEELTYLRDQNRQLIMLVAELKAESYRMAKKVSRKAASVKFETWMKLKRRGSTSEEWRLIGGFREDGVGYRVVKTDGRDLGYFGPDRYESIIFESKAVASRKKALDKK